MLIKIPMIGSRRSRLTVLGFLSLLFLSLLYFSVAWSDQSFTFGSTVSDPAVSLEGQINGENEPDPDEDLDRWRPLRLAPPESLFAIYMTSWVAGTPSIREGLINLIKETKINAVVIDIKEETGRISFAVEDPYLQDIGSVEVRVRDMKELVYRLNEAGVYVIGRVSVFQDPYLAQLWPDEAVLSSGGGLWKDRKGISWVDPGSKKVWDYAVAIGREAFALGFDEINYDYVRFPSDGVMADMVLPISQDRNRSEVLEEFFAYLDQELRVGDIPDRLVISADVFGMVATNFDDLGIGQILEKALPYFDFIAPMVYPSHYPPGWHGLASPVHSPYETVYLSLAKAVERAKAETSTISTLNSKPVIVETRGLNATSSQVAEIGPSLYTKDVFPASVIRPWLQDFNLGATYTPEMVRDQIDAVYDAGISSWMIWSPSNNYSSTRQAIDR